MKRLVWALALTILAGAATAQDLDTNAGRCTDQSVDFDLRIGACTWLLNSGKLSEEEGDLLTDLADDLIDFLFD